MSKIRHRVNDFLHFGFMFYRGKALDDKSSIQNVRTIYMKSLHIPLHLPKMFIHVKEL